MAAVETQTAETEDVDDRDRRAAEEAMAVLPVDEDRYRVYSGAHSDYLVDLRDASCECADWEYREPEGGCKHARRVLLSLGRREIPDGVRVDPALRCQRDRLAGGNGGGA
ncbi:SWIM zinc finger family protein [Halorussus marinus]|uniref:SWIM zinc finger family protein n=1 Tax=Halorussus marinus TaxID=2505976 RepID=UPI00106E9B91|nr:SWIM zinc finger family protein [Halorussus marinus]